MLLTIDIGNTQTTIGLWNGEELYTKWAVSTNITSSSDEIKSTLFSLFTSNNLMFDNITCEDACVSSVVPEVSHSWFKAIFEITKKKPHFITPDQEYGLEIDFKHPMEIGADLIADSLAAIKILGAPVIAVNYGTATNLEVIDKNGTFIGGIVFPGIRTSANALFGSTSKLSSTDLIVTDSIIGKTTGDAISSGILWGEIYRIDGLINRIKEELGYDAPVIASGGYSGLVAKHSKTITHRDMLLTLKGIRLAYEYLQKTGQL